MRHTLKIIIFSTIGISLIAAFIPELYALLSLSTAGLKHLYFWQLITYVFVEQRPLSLGFFLSLAFNMYILWIFGSQLIERSSPRRFLMLYLGAALIGGLTAFFVPSAFLAGSTNAVYAILIAWTILNQNAKLLLFFSIPFRAEWLILGLLGLTIFLDLMSQYWIGAISLIAASIYSYFFTVIQWRAPSPFFFLRKFEKRIFQFFERRKKHEPYARSKIYDIKSGAPVLDDNQFMDAMLDRISRHGEDSLTLAEKKRMKEISAKRK